MQLPASSPARLSLGLAHFPNPFAPRLCSFWAVGSGDDELAPPLPSPPPPPLFPLASPAPQNIVLGNALPQAPSGYGADTPPSAQ